MKRRQFLQSALMSASAGSMAFVGLSSPACAQETSSDAAKLKVDVLVVGGGFAGLTAAVTAAEAGARVLVVEKRAYVGGDGILSAGIIASARSVVHDEQHFTGDASLEKYWSLIESGATDEPLSKVRDNMPNSPIYSGIAKHDPRVIRRCAEMSPEVVAFVRSFGTKFLPINPRQPFLVPSKPGSMPQLAKALVDRLQRANVRIWTDAKISRLLTEQDASSQTEPHSLRLTGAQAFVDGKAISISASAVVLATGGFTDNEKMMRRYKCVWADIPKGFSAVGEGVPPGHDGDGITLGRLVGAAIEDMESMPKLFAAPRPGQKSPSWILFDTETAFLVDKNGRRFCDEHASRYAGCALECFRQKIDGAYIVLDEATFNGPNRNRWRYDELLKQKGLFKGHTIEEAAAQAGVDPAGLRQTIEAVNRDAARGKGDTLFGRQDSLFRALKAPYYISTPSFPVRFKTEGGLEVNPDFQVLRAADDLPIPGLFAAGATCGSISSRLCDVFASGLIAGRTAADFARKKAL